MSTVDPIAVNGLKGMVNKLSNSGANNKFKMKNSNQIYESNVGAKPPAKESTRPKASYVFVPTQGQAYKTRPEILEVEEELIKMIRVTDTFEMQDTLTVQQELIEDPQYFLDLSRQICGQNYLIKKHNIVWESGIQQLVTSAPLWFNMNEPNSYTVWVLYFIERALCINFGRTVENTLCEMPVVK